jgi:oligoribonuclease NrnB/cAMP/cGMP phosphodiesterase (DHH superfamily)
MQLKREMDPNKKDRILRIVSEIGQYSIASITYNPSDIVVFHHDDIDGKLAGQLIYETFSIPNTDRFVCCNYSSTMPDISFIKDTDLVFIVDYCIPLEQLKPIIKSANFVIWLDHHKTSVDMVNNNFDYFADQVKLGNIIMDIDMNRCGAKIVSNKLYKIGTQWNEEVVEAVDKYDRWTKEDIRGDYINQFMYNSAMPYVGSEAWSKIYCIIMSILNGLVKLVKNSMSLILLRMNSYMKTLPKK